jgi:hypothetical protein
VSDVGLRTSISRWAPGGLAYLESRKGVGKMKAIVGGKLLAERTSGHVTTPRKQMPSDCQSIRCGSQDHEGTREISNAALLPRMIAPKAVVRMPVMMVAGMGHLRSSFTMEKNPENGMALSRARVHHVRPTVRKVPIKHEVKDRKMINKRSNVAAVLQVAWV